MVKKWYKAHILLALNMPSFCFESLNASLDPFKKTIVLFIYVFFTFIILWNMKLTLLTAKDKK